MAVSTHPKVNGTSMADKELEFRQNLDKVFYGLRNIATVDTVEEIADELAKMSAALHQATITYNYLMENKNG